MKLIHHTSELQAGNRGSCLAIGFFDGVHLGHQQIIRQTIADAHRHNALALVLTFDRHPNAIVAPDRVPPLIYSLPQKLRALASLGTDVALPFHFDEGFSRQSGEAFIRGLDRDLGKVRSLCVGADFVFGHRRSGNVALLEKLGKVLGFSVHGLAAVALDGQTVSSTRIRRALQTGNLEAASQMLGRPYAIAGRVVQGDRLGRQLGYPTANLAVEGLVLPPNGVYAGRVQVGAQTHPAALNIGVRPSLASRTAPRRVEAHLLDFDGDLYGEELEVEIGDKLRDEKEFADLDRLREQIAWDVAEIRRRF